MKSVTYEIPQGITVNLEMVTPEKALEWLARSPKNRTVRGSVVGALTSIIRSGQWQLTHQGVAFGPGLDAEVFDAQHRLHAVVESGIAVPMMVTRGLPESARVAIDKGRMRSVADEMEMFRGLTNGRTLKATVATCARLFLGGRGSIPFTTVDVFDDWYSCFKPGVDWALGIQHESKSIWSTAAVLGSLAFAHPAAPEKVQEFAAQIMSGAGLSKGDPAFALRHALLESNVRQKSNFGDLTSRVLRACLSHVRGEQLGVLKQSSAGIDFFIKAYQQNKRLLALKDSLVWGGNFSAKEGAQRALSMLGAAGEEDQKKATS